MRIANIAFVSLLLSTASIKSQQSTSSAGRPVDQNGWYTDVSPSDIQDMVNRQQKAGVFGDVIRWVAPVYSAITGSRSDEIVQTLSEAGRDEAIAEAYKASVPAGSPLDMTTIAQAYKVAAEIGLDSPAENEVTNQRRDYNDVSLCRARLLLCGSEDWLSGGIRRCANNVLSAASVSGRQVINIVEVRCTGSRGQIRRVMQPGTVTRESEYIGSTLYFRGKSFSSYCVPCQ